MTDNCSPIITNEELDTLLADAAKSAAVGHANRLCQLVVTLVANLRAARQRLEDIEQKAIAQSEDVQRNWLSPVEAYALRAEINRLKLDEVSLAALLFGDDHTAGKTFTDITQRLDQMRALPERAGKNLRPFDRDDWVDDHEAGNDEDGLTEG